MLSRALSLAAVMLLIGHLAEGPAQAQNLEAGKSPSQIFAGTCTACHRTPRGLLKSVPAGSLSGFLRQHYTTSGDMASLLSAFLISNGATDSRSAKDAKSGGGPDQLDRFGRRLRAAAPQQEAAKPETEPQQAGKPDADGLRGHGRNARRVVARPGEPADPAKPSADGQMPAQAGLDHGPDGRKLSARQKLTKRGRKGGEGPPSVDTGKADPDKPDAASTDAAREEAAKGGADDKPADKTAKQADTKPSGESKPESVGVEVPKEAGGELPPVLRADPVPPVTPAPSASPAVSAAVSNGTPESAATVPSAAPMPSSPPPAVTASAPPVTPAGPPAPPISQ